MTIIGVDIGGSHISAAQVSLNKTDATINAFHESDVDTLQDKASIISSWIEVILKAANGNKDFKVGIAMPGPYDYVNGISLIKDQGKMASLFQLSVKNLLAESLNISTQNISFTNDAEAFLAGESFSGAGKDFSNSIGITLGTGLGSAIKVEEVVKDAKLWTAPFKDGIAEDYLGTSWFTKTVSKNYNIKIKGVKDLLNSDIDSSISRLIFEEFGRNLAEFLFPYAIRLQTQAVVLGGKISLAADHFLPFTDAYLDSIGFSIPFKISKLGEKATLIGACLPFKK